jgi:hypothetical protein
MQIVNIFQRDDNITNFCPSCGVCNASKDGEITPCPHLLFIYLNIADGIMHAREDIKKKLPDDEDEHLDYLLSLELESSFAIEEVCPGPSQSYYLIGYQFLDED